MKENQVRNGYSYAQAITGDHKKTWQPKVRGGGVSDVIWKAMEFKCKEVKME